jgi:hypothetical protein
MIATGGAYPRGHDKDAVAAADALRKADEDAVAAKVAADEAAAQVAAQATAEKRAAHAGRHKAERQRRKFVSKRPKK